MTTEVVQPDLLTAAMISSFVDEALLTRLLVEGTRDLARRQGRAEPTEEELVEAARSSPYCGWNEDDSPCPARLYRDFVFGRTDYDEFLWELGLRQFRGRTLEAPKGRS